MRSTLPHDGAFLAALLVVAILGGALPAVAQQVDAIQQWLASACPVGEPQQAPPDLNGSDPNVVLALVSALQNGPDPTLLAQRESDLSAAYDRSRAFLASSGAAGLSATDVALAQSETASQFISRDTAAFVLGYRTRALQGLAIARSVVGLQAIASFADSTDDPALRAVAREALSGIADINSDGIVNCADLQIVRASRGKTLGQPGFDPRADVNRDGVVDRADVRFVKEHIARDSRCKHDDDGGDDD